MKLCLVDLALGVNWLLPKSIVMLRSTGSCFDEFGRTRADENLPGGDRLRGGQLSDEFEYADIRRWELVIEEFVRFHPSDLVASDRSWSAAQPGTFEKVERYGLCIIFMIDPKKVLPGPYGNPQFFLEFPFKTGREGLVLLLFTSRKFPIAFKMASLGSSGDQDFSVVPNQAGGHVEMRFVVHRWKSPTSPLAAVLSFSARGKLPQLLHGPVKFQGSSCMPRALL